ncbi:MAG: type 1 glutamine amidotransferase [Pseudomonadota bacterium]
MKIGILMTGHALPSLIERRGDYDAIFAQMLAGHGFAFENYAVVDGQFPANAEAADGWLITGSKHGAYEEHDWIPQLEALIREIAAAQRPLVGVCFGHQIIAQALGGKVVKYPGGWSVGRQAYTIDGEVLNMNAWHQDQVVEAPPGARVIGQSAFCENAALAIGDTILTIQPHPEFDADILSAIAEERGRGVVPDALLERAKSDLDLPTDRMDFADRIVRFFKAAVKAEA